MKKIIVLKNKWGDDKVKWILLGNGWIYKNTFYMSHFGSFIPKDIIMDHDSSRKISLYSSLQPYRTIFIPAPKDVFLQFCVLTCCIWYTSILLWLSVQILLAESRDRTEKGRYLQSVCIHYTKVKIMSKKYAYF